MTLSRWTYFTVEELTCHCGCGQMKMHNDFMLNLVALRDIFGMKIPVTSGYRCPAHNAKVSKTGDTGPHTTGRAVDVLINRGQARQLVQLAMSLGFTGIGLKQHGPDSGRIVHLDMVPGPERLWTYP
ncbi:MAG: DUF882 domain-containing protein [Armatimonadetes bacterium]|nr:DUF882 domain-containing protein [Armatimonadota bacterium]